MTTDLETHHRIAVARELCAAAGVPLRDRYGFAASDESVASAVAVVFAEPDDARAVSAMFVAASDGRQEIAEGGMFPSEEFDARIVAALRPLVEDRRAAAARGMR